jgi:sortase A
MASTIFSEKKGQKTTTALSNKLFFIGISIFSLGVLLFILIFYPVIWQEAKYSIKQMGPMRPIRPMSDEFGIVIPKIRANAKVINNIDPFNSKEYQWALTKGVAHAKGTAYPGHAGNTFIFAHSSVDWYIANRYNSVFYLLHKLEKGDKIEMYYKKKKYVYEVTVKKYVDASDVSYLNSQNSLNSLNTSILTLMTCWPPGTTYKRLIVQAKISIDKGN